MTGRLRPSPRLVTGVCLAAVVANTVLVVTGALVRLTGSGLGCPTWPRCAGSSYRNTPAYGVHGQIEFGNRMLTFVLAAVVAACIVVTLRQERRRSHLVRLAWALLAGIVAQAVLGGITVRTHLNPWTVAAHFLLSMVLIAVAVALHTRARESDDPARPLVGAHLRWLGRLLTAVTAGVLAIGTIVTASGPHAGDRSARRTGFDPATVSQLHSDAVMLLIGLTIATVVALAANGAPPAVRRYAAALLAAELAQGVIGYLQYFTGLPVPLVALHVAGACVVWLAAVYLLFALRERRPAQVPVDRSLSAAPGAASAR
ncbi:MAG: COX15/CtaA family protein [Actinomycetota bacterium]|nr:COX15/CtaA family protein [Actinomycetota bacterium]